MWCRIVSGSTDLHVPLKSYYKSGGGAIQTATTIMTKISEVINSLNDIKKNFGDVAVGTPELGVRDNDAWRINVAMNDDHKVYATLEFYPCDENQDKKYQRTVSEIVNRLSGIMEKHGDIPVSTPEIDPYDEDYFNWDISAKMDDDNNCEITMDFNANKKTLKEKNENKIKEFEDQLDAIEAGLSDSKDANKLEEMALAAAKPHGYDPAAKQVFENGYVKGANAMLEAIEEILDRNKQAYNYSKDYYINIDVFKQRIDELKDRKPAVSKEAPEKAFKDGYVEGANVILDEVKEILNENKQVFKYNKESYVNIDVFTQMIDELKNKKPAISEEAASEIALKPDINQEQEFTDEIDDDSLLVPPNASLKIDQLRALAVKLFGENAAFSLCSYPEVDRVCIGYEPVDITIDRIEIKDGQLKLMSENFGGEIDQRYLFGDQVEAISTMLKEVHTAYEKTNKAGETEDERLADAKAKLFATILEAQKDLGDVFSIAPTEISENGDKNVLTEILPDFESPFEDQNIIGGVSHSGDEDCVHNLALCLENVNDVEALGMAVHEAHVKHLEQDAKQAIHDRIVTPSARVFTPEQVGVLNRYHQVATPDTPANEAFSRLMDEVAQEPDVARKSEKWVADTANELDGIAEGITRKQDQGLKR